MPLWGKANTASSAPKRGFDDKGTSGEEAFEDGKLLLVKNTEASALVGVTQSGWVKRDLQLGELDTITITSGGTGYANTDTVNINTKGPNVFVTLITNGSGVVTSLSPVEVVGEGDVADALFDGTQPSYQIHSEEGEGLVLTFKFKGRAGRLSNEVLVALKG